MDQIPLLLKDAPNNGSYITQLEVTSGDWEYATSLLGGMLVFCAIVCCCCSIQKASLARRRKEESDLLKAIKKSSKRRYRGARSRSKKRYFSDVEKAEDGEAKGGRSSPIQRGFFEDADDESEAPLMPPPYPHQRHLPADEEAPVADWQALHQDEKPASSTALSVEFVEALHAGIKVKLHDIGGPRKCVMWAEKNTFNFRRRGGMHTVATPLMTFNIDEVVSLVPGKNTPNFLQSSAPQNAECCFSFMMAKGIPVDIEVKSKEERDEMVGQIMFIIEEYNQKHGDVSRSSPDDVGATHFF